MMKKVGLLALVCCALGGFLMPSCTRRDDAEAIHRLIRNGAKLAEQHDVGGLMEMTSEDFSALPGNRDRTEVRSILLMAFRHYRQFRILYPEPGIDLSDSGDAATAMIYFLIVRKDRSYADLKELYRDPQGWLEAVGDNADLYRLTLDWARQKGDWVATRAHLEPFKGYGFGERL